MLLFKKRLFLIPFEKTTYNDYKTELENRLEICTSTIVYLQITLNHLLLKILDLEIKTRKYRTFEIRLETVKIWLKRFDQQI